MSKPLEPTAGGEVLGRGMLTYRWLVAVLLTVLFGLCSWTLKIALADRAEIKGKAEMAMEVAVQVREQTVILRTQFDAIRADLSEIKSDVKGLVRSR